MRNFNTVSLCLFKFFKFSINLFLFLVPAPQHLSLEKQLNKSVLIGWAAPDPPGNQIIESYHVYVDGVLKVTVKANERTRALVEGVDLNRPHRISVRSVTHDRHTSRDAACTMIIGRDTAHLGPSAVRASNITCSSAIIAWLPANTNHQHVVCVNNVEVKLVKPGVYRQTITVNAMKLQNICAAIPEIIVTDEQ
ncbi:RIMS-binding protein 2-like, partial [Contarinia nasturtii]|uniref:RIMS-binding protein 2-like n=1 Tax=Contarinia nasturtii TaxID=265458 RepID=UPI0012D38264